jgi:uncharacterized RDD family membrane protein YckC
MDEPQVVENYLGYYAGFVSRFSAFLIDVIGIVLISVSITWFVNVIAEMLRVGAILEITMQQTSFQGLSGETFSPLVGVILTVMYIVGYHVFFWSLTGQTPGKIMLGLRVVTTKGKKVNLLRALLRFFGYLVSAVPLFLGYAWILVDDRRQGWHDKISGTFVVYTWAARPDERFLAEQIRKVKNRGESYSGSQSS